MCCTNTVQTTEVESMTQGSRPRPRTQKNFEAKAKDRPLEAKAKDRPSRGQGLGQILSRPRSKDTDASVLKKKGLQIFFQAISKKRFSKFFFRRKRSSKIFFSADLYLRKPNKGLCRFSAMGCHS